MQGVLRRAAAVAALALAAAGGAVAQAPPPSPPPPQPDYHPSLADLMTTAIQPRHTKIGVAGKARDWRYLTYEVNELKNAFNRIARTIPLVDNKEPIEPLITATIRPQIDALAAAVKAEDAGKFDAAYAELTESCNMCHKALKKDWVVIRAPAGDPFPDQVFGRAR